MIPQTLESFYAELKRQANNADVYCWFDGGYGSRRDRDCYYAERIAGFRRIPVRTQTYAHDRRIPGVKFDYIWNRDKPDLAYVIAPDTRVPDYTTIFGAALELAIKAGMESLPMPTTSGKAGIEQIHHAILAYCDELVASNAV